MLNVGDKIKCSDRDDMIESIDALFSEGYDYSADMSEHVITIMEVPEDGKV